MKRLSIALLAVSLAFLPALAQLGAAASAAPEDPESREEIAARIWDRHREAVERNDWRQAAVEAENLYQWRLDQAISNHFSFSSALIRESGHPSLAGDPERVLTLLKYAERLAPDFSEVKFARANFLWLHFSPGNMSAAFWDYGRGVYLAFANPGEAVARWANLEFWVLLGFLLTFFFYSLSLVIRFYRFFLHHLGHLLRVDTRGPLYAVSLLVLLSPLWMGLPWMWLAGLWVLVFWVYAGPGDRGVIVALTLFLLLLPTGLRTHSAVVSSLSKNGVPEIAAAQYGAWSTPLRSKLVALRDADPGDADILASTALVEKKMGKYREAEENFRAALRLNPGWAIFFNNMGNVLLATNRTPEAMEAYREAARLKPNRAAPVYNLGQAHLLNLRLNEAEAEFRRAREIDPDLVSYYTGIASRTPNRQAIDQPLELSRFWNRVLRGGGEEEIGPVFWRHFWAGMSLRYGEWAVVFFLLLLGLVFKAGRRGRPIAACEKCGRLICARCARSRVLGNQCSQCLHAVTPDPARADPETIRAKRAEIMRFREKRRILFRRLSFILPGSGHLWSGRAVEGIIYLFISFLFLAKAVFWQGVVTGPFDPGGVSDLPGKLLAAALFMAFYALVQYRLRRHPKGGDFDFRPA
jgi:tetratricopeptide (TPR) repeat protein